MKLNRVNDYLFKWIFGKPERKGLLLNFINSVLSEGEETDVIRDIELVDRELDPEFYMDKASRLDILGETMSGTKISIEIQTSNKGDISNRSLYYWAKIYQEQLKEGMHYKDLCPVIAINILDFNFFKGEEYHSQFEIREKYREERLNDKLQIHFIELKKWKKLSIKARNRLERWLLFLANNDPMELEEIAVRDKHITEALAAEKKFLSDDQARYIYGLREKAKLDWDSSIATAENRGLERGMAQGIEHGMAQGIERGMVQGIEQGMIQGIEQEKTVRVRKMLSLGMNVEEIAEIYGVSKNEIEKLLQ